MNAEDLFLQHIATIERIAAFVCRRNHVNDDEAAEFAAEVKYRLLEDNYGVIRKFEGRSSFSTYLTTVIQRLFHQYRVERWGKWRPSAEARRLGDKAITLERLLTRDGYSFSEAVQMLTTRADALYSVPELEAIYVRLPARQPRPVLISEEVSPDAASVDAEADEPLLARERERTARIAAGTIDEVISGMSAEERLMLQMRFREARKVPDIAERLHLEAKKVYKRLDKLYAILRTALVEAGVGRDQIDDLLVSGDHDVRVGILDAGAGNGGFGPSHPKSGERAEGGEGRL